MTDDVPDDLLPDDPQHIGGERSKDALIGEAIFQEDSMQEFESPIKCDHCGEESTKRHVGFLKDDKEPVYLCTTCHLKAIAGNAERGNEEFDPDS